MPGLDVGVLVEVEVAALVARVDVPEDDELGARGFGPAHEVVAALQLGVEIAQDAVALVVQEGSVQRGAEAGEERPHEEGRAHRQLVQHDPDDQQRAQAGVGQRHEVVLVHGVGGRVGIGGGAGGDLEAPGRVVGADEVQRDGTALGDDAPRGRYQHGRLAARVDLLELRRRAAVDALVELQVVGRLELLEQPKDDLRLRVL